MNSAAPKVLHEVCGKPMLWYVIEACRQATGSKLAVVVGHGRDEVIRAFAGHTDISWVEQREQKGTGHAALVCEEALKGFDGSVLIIAGDMPLIHKETLEKLLVENARTGHALTLATSILDDPTGYGRILRNSAGDLLGIVEERDCSPEQRRIREVNVSYYCFDGARLFEILHQLSCNNAKGEYYITDAVAISLAAGYGAGAIPAVPAEDAMGINSRADLALIARMMQDRIQAEWMEQGVTIVDPANTWIESGASIGRDAVIYPFSFIGRDTVVGERCRIGPFGHVASGDVIDAGASVGPSPGQEHRP